VNKIAEVSNLIGGIAEQTNLLALNATIEPLAPVTPAAASRWSPPKSNPLSGPDGEVDRQIGRLIAKCNRRPRQPSMRSKHRQPDFGGRRGRILGRGGHGAAARRDGRDQPVRRRVGRCRTTSLRQDRNVSPHAGSVDGRASEVRGAITNVSSQPVILAGCPWSRWFEPPRRRRPAPLAALQVQLAHPGQLSRPDADESLRSQIFPRAGPGI